MEPEYPSQEPAQQASFAPAVQVAPEQLQPEPVLPEQVPVQGDQEAQKHMDQTMDGADDSMSSTITASTVTPLPDLSQNTSLNNSPNPYEQPHRPSTSYSDTAYQYTTHNGSRFNTSSDADTPPRHGYYDANKETHMGQSHSRPSSQMGRYPTSEGNTRSNSYQEQSRSAQQQQQQQQQEAAKNASVVIKVGMVGDAQIGKTSLMVKYVEGSWDEDYIQTLGELHKHVPQNATSNNPRCELHGKDHFNTKHRDHILNMGSGWAERVRQYAAAGVQ